MPRWGKFLFGLAAALAAGWLHHGPLGGGERFVAALEEHAERRVRLTQLPDINVRMQRDPLARIAILSGPATEFQREGLGSYPGLNERVATVPGIARVRWEGEH